jgi:hypothetical protein
MDASKKTQGSETSDQDSNGDQVIQITLTMPKRLLHGIDALALRRNISRAALVKSVLSQVIEVA